MFSKIFTTKDTKVHEGSACGPLPYWQSVQRQLRKALGEAGWNQMMESTIFTAARAQQRRPVSLLA